jgi:hypothetical protein
MIEKSIVAAKKTNTKVRERISNHRTRPQLRQRRFDCGEAQPIHPEQRGSIVQFPAFRTQPFLIQSKMTTQKNPGSIRKATESDLQVGLICADRDGNRIRIDSVRRNGGTGSISYHFLNDELRVQEGVQERTIQQFLVEGWVIAAPGASL